MHAYLNGPGFFVSLRGAMGMEFRIILFNWTLELYVHGWRTPYPDCAGGPRFRVWRQKPAPTWKDREVWR
jgi:hypothetical protein